MSISNNFEHWNISQKESTQPINHCWKTILTHRKSGEFSQWIEIKASPSNLILPYELLILKIFPFAIQTPSLKGQRTKLFGKLTLLNRELSTKLNLTLTTLSKVTMGDPLDHNTLEFFSKYGKMAQDLTVAICHRETIQAVNLENFFKECQGITQLYFINCVRIVSLSFLQFASQLTFLKIESETRSTYDLQPCAGLKQLSSLTVVLKKSESHLDISPLAHCNQLTQLTIQCSKVTGLQSLGASSLKTMTFKRVLALDGQDQKRGYDLFYERKTFIPQTTDLQKPVHQKVVSFQSVRPSPGI